MYDLAKSALDKAFSYMPADYEDSSFFNQAALIYVDNNDCNAAIDYINKAIIIDRDTPDYYLTKGLIFNTLTNRQYLNYSDKQTFHEKSKEMFLNAHELAARKDISVVRANAAGALALYYNFINDEARAETFVQEAVQYGDVWRNGQKVLDILKSRKAAREKALQEQQRQEEETRRRQEEEKRRAEEYRMRCEEEKQEEERKKREMKAEIVKRQILYIIGWFVLVVCYCVSLPTIVYSLAGDFTIPLFLILSIIGTTIPAYAESAYLGYRGFLGWGCISYIIMSCVYSQAVRGVNFFALLIILAVLQFISWKIGER